MIVHVTEADLVGPHDDRLVELTGPDGRTAVLPLWAAELVDAAIAARIEAVLVRGDVFEPVEVTVVE